MIIIIIMNKSQEMTFWRAPEIDFRYETEARKVMVDFKFDAIQVSLHREHSQVGLVKKLTGSLY